VRALFADRITFLSQPGQARELILRGLFDEATTRLVDLQSKMAAKPPADIEKGVVAWVNGARDVYGRLAKAERAMERDPSATAERWWEKFNHTYNTSPAIPTAKRNYARTLEGAGRPAEAKAVYQALAASELPELQKLACAYLANQPK